MRRIVGWLLVATTGTFVGALALPSTSGAAGGAPPMTRFAPLVPAAEPHDCGAGYKCSSNWSGYIASGTTFTSVSAQWQVPSVAASTAPTHSSTWVGIGGNPVSSTGTLVQDGVSQGSSNGQTYYRAWWEVVPGAGNGVSDSQVPIGPVEPGDTVTASVQEDSPGTWTLQLNDPNAGIAFSKTVSGITDPGIPETSAEWIEEAPTTVVTCTEKLRNTDPKCQGNPPPQSYSYIDTLANFGTVQFQNVAATSSGSPTMAPMEMTDTSRNVIAYPGALSNGAFTITYGMPAPGPAPTPTPPTPGPSPTPNPPPDSVPAGYWMVGSDGGVFSYGKARFYGSAGSLPLQRPVVSIADTSDFRGYWLVGSDGGIFAFGNAGYFGSVPGLGIGPAGPGGGGQKLAAPIVGIVPSVDDGGYLMVGGDGGVFAFGDATYEGSCPEIGGCTGTAVAVMPDATGSGYWVVTDQGDVYAFGDAQYYGGPGPGTASPVVSAVATNDGEGYWILCANGAVFAYGDATYEGGASQQGGIGVANPARALVATADGSGYWIIAANGSVYSYGKAPYQGGANGMALNAKVVAATGW